MSSFSSNTNQSKPNVNDLRLTLANARISPEPFAEAAFPANRPVKREREDEDAEFANKAQHTAQNKNKVIKMDVGQSWNRTMELLRLNHKVSVDFHKLIAKGYCASESPSRSGVPTLVSTNCSSEAEAEDEDEDEDEEKEQYDMCDGDEEKIGLFAFEFPLTTMKVRKSRRDAVTPLGPSPSVSTIDVYRSMRKQGFVQRKHFLDQSRVFVANNSHRLKTVRKTLEPLTEVAEGGLYEIVAELTAYDEQGQPSSQDICVKVAGAKILEQMESINQHINWNGVKVEPSTDPTKDGASSFFNVVVVEISKTLDPAACRCTFGGSGSAAVVSPSGEGEGDFKYDINMYRQVCNMRDVPEGTSEPYIHYVYTNEFNQRVASWQEFV